MYESQFSLKRRPFAATPDPKCFLSSGLIQAALDELVVCVEQGQGVAIVSAPAGTGKTLLCERLRVELESRFRVVFLRHASFMTRRALLQSILADLDHAYRRHDEQELRLELVPAIRALNPACEALVLICDEAHMLSDDLLEELRILSDLAENGCPLVRLVLVGQPALEETLALPALEALNQRIRAHICLEPFNRSGSLDYIDYRITWAGGRTEEIFTPESLDLICHVSEGVPRCINQLCDHSLLLAYVAEQTPVAVDTIRDALQDLRQLPLHWNESILSDRTAPTTDRDVTPFVIDQTRSAPEMGAAGMQSFEFGADEPEISSTAEYDDVAQDDFEADSVECEEWNDTSLSEDADKLDVTQKSMNWTMIADEPCQVEKNVASFPPTVRPGEVVEEIVWDRYVAIDGGFPIPHVVQSDTGPSSQVRSESRIADDISASPLPVAPGSTAQVDSADVDSVDVDSHDFEQVCARLNERLPNIVDTPAWDRGGPEFGHPKSVAEVQNGDDWDSLEAELGMAVCELSSEVHAGLSERHNGRATIHDLQQILEIAPGESSSIEIGADTPSPKANSAEVTPRVVASKDAAARPYRNLFSQLRRKQQGLL